jgi:hypothetical protein
VELEPRHTRAPELLGNRWINSEPFALSDLEGSVVLIDFWDSANINCLRVIPYLNEWRVRYEEFGLVAVGVHTSEFKFAREEQHIERAVRRLHVSYPVIVDDEGRLWNAYGCRSWPTRFLIDRDGFLRFVQEREGGYVQFERMLQQLLRESGYRGELPDLMQPLREIDSPGAVAYKATHDIALGYLRGALGNPEGYSPESTIDYPDPGYYLPDRVYAEGKWMNERECLRFEGSEGDTGAMRVGYESLEVNAVLGGKRGEPCVVVLEQDKCPLPKDVLGDDVIVRGEETVVVVDEPRLFNLVKNREFGNHFLKLTVRTPDTEVYSLSFVSAVIPEIISSN